MSFDHIFYVFLGLSVCCFCCTLLLNDHPDWSVYYDLNNLKHHEQAVDLYSSIADTIHKKEMLKKIGDSSWDTEDDELAVPDMLTVQSANDGDYQRIAGDDDNYGEEEEQDEMVKDEDME